MFQRTLASVVRNVSETFPVLLITGPRQVGKTTLLEMCSTSERGYVTLDDLDVRYLAQHDPGLFLQTYPPPIIIDEIQYAPDLLSYIKVIVDRKKINGLFWLTGSQKFHLMEGISESLAGRVAVIDMLGLSQSEIQGRHDTALPFEPTRAWLTQTSQTLKTHLSLMDVYGSIWRGAFPRLVETSEMSRDIFYRSYVQTYIQRDVKSILNITNETAFYKFLTVTAARTAQLLNYNEIAREVGIDSKTVKAWLSLLEASGLVYLLYPYHNNLIKRTVKTPKLYFLDTGLCSFLTKWPDVRSLESGAFAGPLLETYLFSEILKSYIHNGKTPHLHYYRDADQNEIDLLIESGNTLFPVEFKKTGTPTKTASKHFHLISRFGKTVGEGAVLCFIDKPLPLSEEVMAIPIAYV